MCFILCIHTHVYTYSNIQCMYPYTRSVDYICTGVHVHIHTFTHSNIQLHSITIVVHVDLVFDKFGVGVVTNSNKGRCTWYKRLDLCLGIRHFDPCQHVALFWIRPVFNTHTHMNTRERTSKRETATRMHDDTHTHTNTHARTHTHSDRERERKSRRETATHMHNHTHPHTHTHTYIHTHTHTHTPKHTHTQQKRVS